MFEMKAVKKYGNHINVSRFPTGETEKYQW
jgi:hypothetical protein